MQFHQFISGVCVGMLLVLTWNILSVYNGLPYSFSVDTENVDFVSYYTWDDGMTSVMHHDWLEKHDGYSIDEIQKNVGNDYARVCESTVVNGDRLGTRMVCLFKNRMKNLEVYQNKCLKFVQKDQRYLKTVYSNVVCSEQHEVKM